MVVSTSSSNRFLTNLFSNEYYVVLFSLKLTLKLAEKPIKTLKILNNTTGEKFEPFCPCQRTSQKRCLFLCEKIVYEQPEGRGACRGVRVSVGDLCEAEAPTEPAGESRILLPLPDGHRKSGVFYFLSV